MVSMCVAQTRPDLLDEYCINTYKQFFSKLERDYFDLVSMGKPNISLNI